MNNELPNLEFRWVLAGVYISEQQAFEFNMLVHLQETNVDRT